MAGMKRRGFLGVLAGGAVAGPAAAKQAVTAASQASQMNVGGVIPSICSMAVSTKSADAEHKTWLMGEVERCRRILSGAMTDDEVQAQRLYDETARLKFELETGGLRSMSEPSKFTRMRLRQQRIEQERERHFAKQRLTDYLKELAGME